MATCQTFQQTLIIYGQQKAGPKLTLRKNCILVFVIILLVIPLPSFSVHDTNQVPQCVRNASLRSVVMPCQKRNFIMGTMIVTITGGHIDWSKKARVVYDPTSGFIFQVYSGNYNQLINPYFQPGHSTHMRTRLCLL